MSTAKPTIAFFGATGGCAGAALAAALRDGYSTTALARTPDKLRKQLETTHSIPQSTHSTSLTIHAGNVKSVEDVKKTLVSPTSPAHLVDTIVCGVGGAPKLQWSLFTPVTLDDPHVVETAASTILAAISSLADEGIKTTASGAKSVVVTISTTGVGDGANDVPWGYYLVWHYLLQKPHADKRVSEQLLMAGAKNGTIRDFVIVRPTLLTDGASIGLDKVRTGWEWGDRKIKGREAERGPELGYTVGRTDVGEWIFQEAIRKGGWEGKAVTLTY